MSLAAGAGSAAFSRRAASSVRCLCRSCHSECNHRHQQHYFQRLHNLLLLEVEIVVVTRMKSSAGEKSVFWCLRFFLNAEDVYSPKNVPARLPGNKFVCGRVRENGVRCV